MKKFGKRGLLVLAVGVFLCIFPVGGANAVSYYDYGYCGILKNPDTWCAAGGGYRQNIYNKAMYVGAGTVRVGIRQDLQSGLILNRKFGNNEVSTNSQTYWSIAQVANASSGRHTIYGYAQACDGSCASPASAQSVTRMLNTANYRSKKGMRKSVLAARFADGGSIATREGKGKHCVARKRGADYTENCAATDVPLLVTEDHVLGTPTGRTLVFGEAPEGATSVRVSLGGGASEVVTVENGVFSTTVDGTADQQPRVTAVR